MKKMTGWGFGATAAAGALLMFGYAAVAQQKAPTTTPGATTTTPSTAPATTKAPTKDKKAATPSPCQGLAEAACKGNTECSWIVPKKVEKTGKVDNPYCRKVAGVAKKTDKDKAKTGTTGTATGTPPAATTTPPAKKN